MTAEIERGERGFDGEMRTQTLAARGTGRRKSNGLQCAGDINCLSTHCDQSGICVPMSDRRNLSMRCDSDWQCKTHRCAPISAAPSGVTANQCIDAKPADKNNALDSGETDVDCGGPTSPFACAIGEKCATDDDCVAGACLATMNYSMQKTYTCRLVGTSSTDAGRFRLRANLRSETPPYSSSISLLPEAGPAAQITAVTQAKQVYDSSRKLVAAETTRIFQHETCVEHLLSNGCSSVTIQTRTHRAAYDYVACPQSARAAIGIMANSESVTASTQTVTFASEAARSSVSLAADPYLCNHSFTRGVRAISFSPAGSTPVGGLADSATGGVWDGLQVQAVSPSNSVATLAWLAEVRENLLATAACYSGRVWLGASRVGTAPIAPVGAASMNPGVGFFVMKLFCSQRDPRNRGIAVMNGTLDAFAAQPLKAADWAFVKANVSWWESLDIYSIDPEGNPNLPANFNMQSGWSSMFPSYNFGAYAASWGVTGLTRGTYKDTIAYGTGTGASFTPFNMGW